MNKPTLPTILSLLTLLMISGCTIGEPDSYTLYKYEGENKSWSAKLDHVFTYDKTKPEDLLHLSARKQLSSTVGEVEYSIDGTDIRGTISLSDGKGSTAVKGLKPLIEEIVAKDRLMEDPIKIILRWEEKEEMIELHYETAISRDTRSIWGKLASLFK